MKRLFSVLLVFILTFSFLPTVAGSYSNAIEIQSSFGPVAWVKGTQVTTDLLDSQLLVRDIEYGTFSFTAPYSCNLSFTIDASAVSVSGFQIEIWREDADGDILRSDIFDVIRGGTPTIFTVYGIESGETIYWQDVDFYGDTFLEPFYLVLSADTGYGYAYNNESSYDDNPYPDYYIGAIVTMGVYPQMYERGQYVSTEIEWIVLDIQGENALLISKNGLDTRQFNSQKKKTTWEQSPMRKWLNGDFYNNQFRKWEKEYILTTTVTADENPDWDGDPGRDTQDKVFLLSIVEALKYMPEASDRLCEPTEYAKHRGGYCNDDGYGWWWLRSPGNPAVNGTMVHSSGNIYSDGSPVSAQKGLLRPCMWVKMH